MNSFYYKTFRGEIDPFENKHEFGDYQIFKELLNNLKQNKKMHFFIIEQWKQLLNYYRSFSLYLEIIFLTGFKSFFTLNFS